MMLEKPQLSCREGAMAVLIVVSAVFAAGLFVGFLFGQWFGG